jgi:hypothetical protein
MNRRENIKLLLTGTLGTGLIWSACSPEAKQDLYSPQLHGGTAGGRSPEETVLDQKLLSETFFTKEEMQKLGVLVDIIIPADEISESASLAKVPDFIEFMAKDQPSYQTPLRGGMMWLDHQADERFAKLFLDLSEEERISIIDDIAWPDKANMEFETGVSFFNVLRNLTVTGYYTTEIGFKDLGYLGNRPNVWDGVPQEVMDRYGLEPEKKYDFIYLKPEDRSTLASWNEQGNLRA